MATENLPHVVADFNLFASIKCFFSEIAKALNIHRIHKWPPRGTVWNLAHEIEVGKARLMGSQKKKIIQEMV